MCSRCEKRSGVCSLGLCEEHATPMPVLLGSGSDCGTKKCADLSSLVFRARAWNEFSCDSVTVLSLATSVEDDSLCNNLQWVIMHNSQHTIELNFLGSPNIK